MENLTKILLLSAVLILINSCATSNLSYTNEQLNLQINDSHLQVQGTQLKQQRENFSTLYLTQYFLHLEDGSNVVYEKAKTDMQYEFEPTTTRTISIIFDAKKVIKVYYDTIIY